ncbi:hypothetical protein AAZX31_01G094600 [Glycine max]
MLCLITPSLLWGPCPSPDSSSQTMWILSLKKLNLRLKLLLLPWLSKYMILHPHMFMFICMKLNSPEQKKSLAQALQDRAHAKKEARKWFMIGDYFYNKITRWKFYLPPRHLGSHIHLSRDFDDSSDEFVSKLDEEVAKQKGEKK